MSFSEGSIKNYKKHFELHTDFKRNIIPIVFLHNFSNKTPIKNFEKEKIAIFYKNEEEKLNNFLKKVLKYPTDFTYKIKPQPKLIEKIDDIRENRGFIFSSQQNKIVLKIIKIPF